MKQIYQYSEGRHYEDYILRRVYSLLKVQENVKERARTEKLFEISFQLYLSTFFVTFDRLAA